VTSFDAPTLYCTRTNTLVDVYIHGPVIPADRLRAYHADYGPDLVVLPFSEACRRHEDAAKSPPVEITRRDWQYALEVLPPLGWRNDGPRESFKMSERITGCITTIYVRLGDRHFQFADDIRTPHDQCCARVAASRACLASEQSAPSQDGPER